MGQDLSEYRALVQKVNGSTAAIEARRARDLSCRRGCSECCHVSLDLLPVETALVTEHLASLDPDLRQVIRDRAEGGDPEACVMLDEHGACAIYDARPLVCRTQGHALAYPVGLVPAAAVRARNNADIAWCPLNYQRAAPEPGDVLSAELLERLLFVVNRRFVTEAAVEPELRTSLRVLARGG